MATHGESKAAVVAAVIGNLAIAVIKFIAAGITGSSAMISEGIHSLVDTGNGGLLLHGMNRARKPPDDLHPFGYGKALYFWTLVVSISIFGIGGGLSLYEGISHMRHVAPEAMASDPTVNYIVLGLAAVIEGWSFSVALKTFRAAKGKLDAWQYIRGAKDPTTYTVLLEDSAAMLGLVLAFLGVFFGHLLRNPYLDGAASVMIGLLLMGVAFILAFETKSLLLGEGVDPVTLADIRRRVEAIPGVEKAGDILTMYMGPQDLLVNLGVVFKPGTGDAQMHEAIRRIEKSIQSAHPECIRIFIEAESLAPQASPVLNPGQSGFPKDRPGKKRPH
jgi:cation diffusion facilitator family transporter